MQNHKKGASELVKEARIQLRSLEKEAGIAELSLGNLSNGRYRSIVFSINDIELRKL